MGINDLGVFKTFSAWRVTAVNSGFDKHTSVNFKLKVQFYLSFICFGVGAK